MTTISGKYNAKELRDAATRLHTTVETVLDASSGTAPLDMWQLERLARKVTYNTVTLGMIIENARAYRRDLRQENPAQSCLERDSFHCRDGQHCRCKSCHDAGKGSLFPDLSAEVAREDDTITARELKNALIALVIPGNYIPDDLANRIFKHAADSREPEYSPGTVVRDAKGDVFQRTSSGAWFMFGLAHAFAHDIPKRPLEVV